MARTASGKSRDATANDSESTDLLDSGVVIDEVAVEVRSIERRGERLSSVVLSTVSGPLFVEEMNLERMSTTTSHPHRAALMGHNRGDDRAHLSHRSRITCPSVTPRRSASRLSRS